MKKIFQLSVCMFICVWIGVAHCYAQSAQETYFAYEGENVRVDLQVLLGMNLSNVGPIEVEFAGRHLTTITSRYFVLTCVTLRQSGEYTFTCEIFKGDLLTTISRRVQVVVVPYMPRSAAELEEEPAVHKLPAGKETILQDHDETLK